MAMLADNLILSIAGSIIAVILIAVITLVPWIKDRFQPEDDIDLGEGVDQVAQCVAQHATEGQARQILQSVAKVVEEREDDLFGTEARVLKDELPHESIREDVMIELEILEKFSDRLKRHAWDQSSAASSNS